MTYICQHPGCKEESMIIIRYLEDKGPPGNGHRCFKHTKEIGDHDLNGRLDDKRRKENRNDSR